jgi:hypothetical protein
LDTGRTRADLPYSGVEHFFATTGDDDFCAFRYESLCRSEADAGASTGDKGDLSFKFLRHEMLSFGGVFCLAIRTFGNQDPIRRYLRRRERFD